MLVLSQEGVSKAAIFTRPNRQLQIHLPKGPAKELQLPLWDSSRIFQVESRGEMHGVVGIFEFLCPTAPLMTLMTIGFDDFAKKGSRLAPW